MFASIYGDKLLLPALVYDSLSVSRNIREWSKNRLINDSYVLCTSARMSEGYARVASNYDQPRSCIVKRTFVKARAILTGQ